MRTSGPGVAGFLLLLFRIHTGGAAEAADTFQLRIPEGTSACGNFIESLPVREVLALKNRLAFKAGLHVLRADGTSPAELFDWIEFKPEGPRIPPSGPGIWKAQLVEHTPEPRYRFTMSQEFRPEGGETLQVSFLLVYSSQATEIVLDPTALSWGISPYSIALWSYPGDALPLWFLPCTLEHLPLWTVDLRFKNGDRAHFEERYQELPDSHIPAELVLAELTVEGRTHRVEDYWRLAHAAGHRNRNPSPDLLAILDESVEVAGVGKVRALLSSEGFTGQEPRAFYLGEDLEPLAPIELSSFVRRPAGSPLPPLFRRGDVDSSGNINLTDAVRILLHLFSGSPVDCADAADVDSYGTVGIEDPILLLGYLFLGQSRPLPPGPRVCGQDPRPDDLPDCPHDLCPN
jgi:hypothetical protein